MRESRKEKIVDIAAKHFSKHGFESTSLEEVAVEVGITKPAIYYHFKDKSALYESVLLGRLTRLANAVESAVGECEGVEEKLSCYIETFGEFLKRNRCFAAILAHEFADNGENMPDSATRELARTLNIVTTILNEGIATGIFEMENPMVVQMMIVSTLIMHQTTRTLRGRVTPHVAGEYKVFPEPDVDDLARILSKKIIKAIKKGES